MRNLRTYLKWGCFIFSVFAAASLCGWWAKNVAIRDLKAQAVGVLSLASVGLRNELEKQRLVPILLADDIDIQNALKSKNPADIYAINEKLAKLAGQSRSSTIYLLDREGKAIASSNFRETDSFIGSDFNYRGYYRETLAYGQFEQFGFGAVSHHAGFYFASRVGPADAALGVVVAKREPAEIETAWKASGQLVYLADEYGVIILSSDSAFRFRSEGQLSPKDLQIEMTRYSPEISLNFEPLRFKQLDNGLLQFFDGQSKENYFPLKQAVSGPHDDYQLTVLMNSQPFLRKTVMQAQTSGALVTALSILSLYWFIKRRRLIGQRQMELRQRAKDLEEGVRERTTALLASNERLYEEIDERERAETRVIQLREELAQANRLTTLGQITAGIAHEINQPLSAIRTYAQNGVKFLALGNPEKANDNFATIIGLTDRLASITEGLRSFARRQRQKSSRIDVVQSIDGAFLIVKTPMQQKGIKIEWTPPSQAVYVIGERVPLEQVFVNLLRNAADAVSGRALPRVLLTLDVSDEKVFIRVADNGPGVDASVKNNLFKPFVSTRSSGLGLGLVISSDIIRDFGGRLSVDSDRELSGAVFTVELPQA